MRLIKFLLTLIFVGILSSGLKAQSPSPRGYPITNSNGWIRYGWLQSDSGRIDAPRDTNFTPRFIPTTVYWQHAGVDTAFWTFTKTTGQRWVKQGTGSGTSGSYVPLADSGLTYVTPTNLADSIGNQNLRAVTNRGNNTNVNYNHNVNYIEEYFAGSSLPSGWANGGAPSYTVSGGKINFSGGGGGGGFDTYVYNTKGILMEKTTLSATQTINSALSSTTYGIAIGYQSYNAYGYSQSIRAGLDTRSTSGNYGKIYIQSSSGTYVYSDSLNTNINNGDIINISLERNGWIYSLIVRNYTQNWSLRLNGIVTNAATPFILQNSSYASIYHLGGSMSVDSFKYTINAPSYTDIIFIGNSITYGQAATTMNNRWVNMVGVYFNNIGSGGGADATDNILNRLGEIIAIHPKRVYLYDVAGNDILFGVATATWQANLITIRDSLVNAGIQVIWSNGQPRTGVNETAQKNFIETTFKKDLIIDTWSVLVGTGTDINVNYTTDGTHLNNLGSVILADAINYALGFQKYPLEIGNFVPNSTPTSVFFSGGNSDLQQSAGFIYDSLNSQLTTRVFKAKDITGAYTTIFQNPASGNASYPRTNINTFSGGTINAGNVFASGNATGATQIPSFISISTNSDDQQASSKQLLSYQSSSLSQITTSTATGTFNTTDLQLGGIVGSTTGALATIKTDGKVGINTVTPDSLFTVNGGGLYTNRGVRHENLPSGASTDSVVTVASDGTLKKRNMASVGIVPTLQQIFNVESNNATLTTDNNIIATGHQFTVYPDYFQVYSQQGNLFQTTNNTTCFSCGTLINANLGYIELRASNANRSGFVGQTSNLFVDTAKIQINPFQGNLFADTLNSSSNTDDSVMVWRASTGKIGVLAKTVLVPDQHLVSHRGVRITTNVAGDSIWIDDYVRVATSASASTITPNIDTTNMYTVTALATNPTFAAPTGTPYDGQQLIIRVKDDGTSRSFTWNGIYRAGTDVALPTATTISKTYYITFRYNNADTKWDLLDAKNGF